MHLICLRLLVLACFITLTVACLVVNNGSSIMLIFMLIWIIHNEFHIGFVSSVGTGVYICATGLFLLY